MPVLLLTCGSTHGSLIFQLALYVPHTSYGVGGVASPARTDGDGWKEGLSAMTTPHAYYSRCWKVGKVIS